MNRTLAPMALAGLVALAACAPSAESETPERRILPVETVTTQQEDRWESTRSYTARWEPRRTSRLAFELPGTVIEVLGEEGEEKAAGTPLARLDTLRLQAQRAEVAAARDEAQTALDLAKLTRDRIRGAAERGAISPQRQDEVDQDVTLREAGLARAEAQLRRIDADLEKSEILAPYAGEIARRWVDEGDVVGASMPVFTFQESAAWELRVGLSSRNAANLAAGQRVVVETTEGLIEGAVERILPNRETTTRTVDAIVSVREAPVGVRSGDLAQVQIADVREESGFWLPISALTANVRGLWRVYVVVPAADGEGSQLESRSIDIRHTEADRVFVVGALTDGERVVADGLQRVVAGQRVRPVEAS